MFFFFLAVSTGQFVRRVADDFDGDADDVDGGVSPSARVGVRLAFPWDDLKTRAVQSSQGRKCKQLSLCGIKVSIRPYSAAFSFVAGIGAPCALNRDLHDSQRTDQLRHYTLLLSADA
jgi:hypothetical protein